MTLERFRESAVGPSVVLLSICIIVAFALAEIYQITKPVIDRVERENADAARSLVLSASGSEGFAEITGVTLPEGVEDAYRANNGSGYVFKASGQGFGGPVVFMVGMDSQGNVTGIELFSHEETPGLGTKVGKEDYLVRYYGDVAPDSVEAVAGATRTTNALKAALSGAKAAYELVR